MKLKEAALLAEVIGGIAIVLTLIALILEVRENTDVIRATAYGQSMDSLNEWRMTISESEELSRLYQLFVFRQTEDLTENEEFRLYIALNHLWGVYEKAYFANEYGTLGPSEWSRFERQTCRYMESIRNMSPQFQAATRSLWTDEFSSYVDTSCAGQLGK